jgi:hypothetical protein
MLEDLGMVLEVLGSLEQKGLSHYKITRIGLLSAS